MAIYLYGLVLARNAHLVPAHITGLGGSRVRVLGCDDAGLDALVSTLDRSPARASLDDVRAHDHALQAVVHHGATAAATRFGQTFLSDAQTREHVNERGGRVAALLEAYEGCVEMRLLLPHAMPPDTPEVPVTDAASPGRAYLEGLRNTVSTGRVKGLGLRAALGPVVRAERVEELPLVHGVVFSHLVQRDQEPAYREAVTALPALAEAKVVGPLALYSFAEAGE